VDLGNYGAFGHYLRVDDTPHLFFVHDDRPVRDFVELPRKWLCVLAPDESTVRLWQILRDDGTHASHPRECTFAYVRDGSGESIVVAGGHYDPNPTLPYAGFMYRRGLRDGRELWRLPTQASPAVIRHVPSVGVILAFFLNGEELVLNAVTGSVVRRRCFEPDGLPSVVFSCAVTANRIAIGTVDGRVGVSSLSDFLR
jgi:hypothetical protein